jgi:hypothetical protein
MEQMAKMKIILIVLAALLTTPAVSAVRLQAWQRETLALIKYRKGVLEARWRSPEKNALWVSVELDTYHAESIIYDICNLLKDAGSPTDQITDVFIFDPASYRGSGWPRMTFQCR